MSKGTDDAQAEESQRFPSQVNAQQKLQKSYLLHDTIREDVRHAQMLNLQVL